MASSTITGKTLVGTFSLVNDTDPKLGANLDMNGSAITAPSGNITDFLDDDSFATASATTGATSESIKALNDVVRTVALGGTGVTALPVMYAGRSGNQVITTSTFTKVQFNNEVIDSNSNYDPTTNFRFTPTIAGTYLVCLNVSFDVCTDQMVMIPRVYKNGAAYQATTGSASGIGQNGTSFSVNVAMNGSTDYIEGYCYQASGVSRSVNTNSSMSISWVGA